MNGERTGGFQGFQSDPDTVMRDKMTILHEISHFQAYCTSIQALLEFVTTLGQGTNSDKIQYVTESDKAVLSEHNVRNRLSRHRMQCLRIRLCDYLIL